ncbi:MAG: hypothetical protein MHPSP_004247 [Paramarteilia canceri]
MDFTIKCLNHVTEDCFDSDGLQTENTNDIKVLLDDTKIDNNYEQRDLEAKNSLCGETILDTGFIAETIDLYDDLSTDCLEIVENIRLIAKMSPSAQKI